MLRALRSPNAVLLVDEIDRADDEFEAFLLEVLSTNAVTIPELGHGAGGDPPLVVLTSNRTREVHDALKRRCLYHWVEHPGLTREVEILRTRLPEVPARLAEQVALAVQRLRDGADGPREPTSSSRRGSPRPSTGPGVWWPGRAASSTSRRPPPRSGAVCKYREDAERVRASLDRLLAG